MKKLLPIAGVTLALALTLTGCSGGDAKESSKESPKPTNSSSSTATPEDTEKPDSSTPAGADEVIVTFDALGEKGADDEYAHFPVDIAVTVPSITPLSDTELAGIMEVADADQKNTFAAFDFYKVIVNETYISGDDPKNQATYTNYNVIDADGAQLNDLPLIGFDWCESSSFSEDFISGTPNESCLIGAVAKGAEAPAGVQYAQYDTKYDPSEGEPVAIYLKK